MPRPLSDRSIRRRAEIVYHRAQALARNPKYQRDLTRLQRRARQRKLGSVFTAERLEADLSFTDLGWEARAICRRARLTRLIHPKHLRTLTVEVIENYHPLQLFVDIPGWDMVRIPEPRPGARKVPDPITGGAAWFVEKPIALRGLRKRHRLAVYTDTWQIYDLWQESKGKSGRERSVIDAVWPGKWEPRPSKILKAPIHQRLYDHIDLAKELIRAAYPPDRERNRNTNHSRKSPSRT